MKCFAYLRVSSVGQTDGDGYTRQLLACEKYAAANDIEIAEVFRESMTGKSDLEDRPALGLLLAALESNGVRTVIVEKLDRVARDLMVQETIMGDLRRRGFTLISTAEPDLCSEEPSRVLIRQIFGALAQWERACLVLKLRGARERIKAETGRCDGKKPYGTLPGEAETLAWMRMARAAGCTYQEIASNLNVRSINTRAGGAWLAQTVGKILARQSGE